MQKASARFTRGERVKSASDFKRLFRKGRRAATRGAKLFYLENALGANRIGFSLPRGYGNAVARNASKRYSREAYRALKARIRAGYDMLLLVFPGGDSLDSRKAQLLSLCKKAGLLKE